MSGCSGFPLAGVAAGGRTFIPGGKAELWVSRCSGFPLAGVAAGGWGYVCTYVCIYTTHDICTYKHMHLVVVAVVVVAAVVVVVADSHAIGNVYTHTNICT